MHCSASLYFYWRFHTAYYAARLAHFYNVLLIMSRSLNSTLTMYIIMFAVCIQLISCYNMRLILCLNRKRLNLSLSLAELHVSARPVPSPTAIAKVSARNATSRDPYNIFAFAAIILLYTRACSLTRRIVSRVIPLAVE